MGGCGILKWAGVFAFRWGGWFAHSRVYAIHESFLVSSILFPRYILPSLGVNVGLRGLFFCTRLRVFSGVKLYTRTRTHTHTIRAALA